MGATVSDLVLRYLDKDLTESGGTPTQYTCSGGSARTAICAALSGKTNMEGGLMRWDVGDNADANQWSWVNSYTDGTTTITVDDALPNDVVAGDKFTLLRGGKFIGDQRIPGMVPNDWDLTPTNCTGIEFININMINDEGSGTLKIYVGSGSPATIEATWTPPGGTEGARVDITNLSTDEEFTLVGGGTGQSNTSKYCVMKRNASAFPGSDQSDTIVLTRPLGVFVSPITGTEAESGITIYRPVGLINVHASGSLYDLKCYLPNPYADDGAVASTVASGSPGGIGTGADTLEVTDATNWPDSGWIAKIDGAGTVQDIRYCYNKSGNEYSVMNPAGGMRGYTAAAWNAGDNIIPCPWMDIGLDAPLNMGSPDLQLFEDPATESTAPSGVTFTTPMNTTDALSIGNLAASDVYCVWERFYIPAGQKPVTSALARMYVDFEVDTE